MGSKVIPAIQLEHVYNFRFSAHTQLRAKIPSFEDNFPVGVNDGDRLRRRKPCQQRIAAQLRDVGARDVITDLRALKRAMTDQRGW